MFSTYVVLTKQYGLDIGRVLLSILSWQDGPIFFGLANQNERFTLYHPWVLPAIVFVINEAAVVLFPDTFLESIQTADGSQSDTTLIFEIN